MNDVMNDVNNATCKIPEGSDAGSRISYVGRWPPAVSKTHLNALNEPLFTKK